MIMVREQGLKVHLQTVEEDPWASAHLQFACTSSMLECPV